MVQALHARTGGRILVDALKAHNVDTAFGVPGESYLEVLDGLYDAQSIRFMTCRHEAGAASMMPQAARAPPAQPAATPSGQ